VPLLGSRELCVCHCFAVAARSVEGKRDTFIEESAGQSFGVTFIVSYFDTLDEMHAVYNRYKGHTAVSVDGSGWRLVE